jgi:hypothetical protein
MHRAGLLFFAWLDAHVQRPGTSTSLLRFSTTRQISPLTAPLTRCGASLRLHAPHLPYLFISLAPHHADRCFANAGPGCVAAVVPPRLRTAATSGSAEKCAVQAAR